MTSSDEDYLLGSQDLELARLGFQHRVWARYAFAQWERAGFGPGQTLLDLGCGPGFATVDLAHLVGPAGRVIAVDGSKRFVGHLEATCAALGLAQVETRLGDVHGLDLPAASVDGAYARWVLCFVRDPESVIRRVARALRPGAALAILDYFNYLAVTLAPRSEVFDRVVRAVFESWRGHNGDLDVMSRVPQLLTGAGLRVAEVRPIVRVARPGSALWEWPGGFFRGFVPKLVEEGYLTAGDQQAFEAEWRRRSGDRTTFLSTPPMLEVIGVKD